MPRSLFKHTGGLTLILLCMVVCLGCAGTHRTVVVDELAPTAEIPPPSAEGSTTAQATPYRPEGQGPHQPSVAVLLNGPASVNVTEWESQIREALALAGAGTSGPGFTEENKWTAKFENAFIQSLLKSGLKVVDRATVRQWLLTSAGNARPVEPQSLRGKADILTEILVSQEAVQKSGYVFRANAVRTESGDVLVTVYTTFLKTGLPGPEDVARYLAEDLTSALKSKLK